MKSIILLRHGKSDWAEEYGEDHDRPLNKRGEKAAALMGRFLAGVEQVPDLVITSTALRARETARLASEAGRWACEVKSSRSLYETTPEKTLDVIRGIDGSSDSVLLVGHEPTWSVLAGRLIGSGSLRMPTAGMVRIDTQASQWKSIAFGSGTLIWMVTPKILDTVG